MVVVCAFNPSNSETYSVSSRPAYLQSKFQENHGYKEKPSLKNKTKQKPTDKNKTKQKPRD